MQPGRSVSLKAAAAALALVGAGVAQAGSNVYWNVGVQAAPGVSIGVGNTPVVVAPAPVYRPVYTQPVYTTPVYSRPVVYAPPVVVQPAPVVVGGPFGFPPGHRHHHKHWQRVVYRY